MGTLEFARDIWKEFELNKSSGAGMTITDNNNIVIKKHGYQFNTDNLKEMPASIAYYKQPIKLTTK